MQCSSCGFENMPGSEMCGRCASSLRLSTAVMDVQPPRAGKLAKKLRRVMPGRTMYAVRDTLEALPRPRVSTPRVRYNDLLPWSVVWRMTVPGLLQRRHGQRVRARLFFWSFIAFLLPSLLLLGSQWGSILLGLAFSVHSSAAVDYLNTLSPQRSLGPSLRRSILASLALLMCLYLPAGWLISRVAWPRTVQMSSLPFRPGDVVLVNRSLHPVGFPRPGQVVLYELPQVATQAGEIGGPQRRYQYQGQRIDRILAVEGDRVMWNKGTLTINGKLSALRPLNETNVPPRLELTVPEDRVLIVPTTTPNINADSPMDLWESLSCVRISDVAGTVYMRSQPLSRMMFVQ